MKGLQGLIRLHKWRLDERRRKLADLESLKVSLARDAERIESAIAVERGAASASLDGARAFSAFLDASLARRRHLDSSRAEIEREIVLARDGVNEAYQELKRYETVAARQREHAERLRRRREQARMDEIGATLHRRTPRAAS